MKYHLWFYRSFLVQTGEFKAETFFTCSHNFNAIGKKQFHKNLFMVKSSDDNWDLLRVQASKTIGTFANNQLQCHLLRGQSAYLT